MASDKSYLQFVLDELSALELSYRPMMGEYVLYCDGKVVGGIYDNRLLLKPTKSALAILKEEERAAQWEIPYEGAKEMIAADAEDCLTVELIQAVAADLPEKRK